MNASKPNEKETAETTIFTPFPEPQTMPKGWDVSGLISKRKQSHNKESASEMERKYRYPGIMYD
jgi:hypothetical protein